MKQTITLKGRPKYKGGPPTQIQVEADVKDGLAVHLKPDIFESDEWVVTHVKSGLSCGTYSSKVKAQRGQKLFASLEVNGVKLADMSACEALTLHPILLEKYIGKLNRPVTEDEINDTLARRDETARILACSQ